MIPKIIHYCWFGKNDLPPLALKCIGSWKRFFPDYEIKEWNEENFDVCIIPYTQEAYEAGKYAFVSDYARFWILYNYGGLYFDVDVEVIKDMQPLLDKGPFMGCEHHESIGVNPGLGISCYAKHPIYKSLLEYYSGLHFILPDGQLNTRTIVEYTTEVLFSKGLVVSDQIQDLEDLLIYPVEYFCPISYKTNQLNITSHTYSIHHYTASWKSGKDKLKYKIQMVLGKKLTSLLVKIKRIFN